MKVLLSLLVASLLGCGSGLLDPSDCPDAGVPVPMDAGRECVEFRYDPKFPICAEVPPGWSCKHSTDLCFCCED